MHSGRFSDSETTTTEGGNFSKDMEEDYETYSVIISGGFDKKLCVWNYDTGQLIKRTEDLGFRCVCAMENAGNRQVAVTFRDGGSRLYEVGKNGLVLIKQFKGHQTTTDRDGTRFCNTFGLDVDTNKRLLFTGALDKIVKMWNLEGTEGGKFLENFTGHKDRGIDSIESLKVVPGTSHFFSGGYLGWMMHQDFEKGKMISLQRRHKNFIFSQDYSEEKQVLFTCSADKTSKMIDPRVDEVVHTFKGANKLQSVLYLKDSDELILGEGSMYGDDTCGNAHVVDLKTWKVKESWRAHQNDLHTIVQVPTHDRSVSIITNARDHTLAVWTRHLDNENDDSGCSFRLKYKKMKESGPVCDTCYVTNNYGRKDMQLHRQDVQERLEFWINKDVSGGITIIMMKMRTKITLHPIMVLLCM